MKITKRQLRRIIREATSQYDASADEWYEERHAMDQEDIEYLLATALEVTIQENPGIDGKKLMSVVRGDPIFHGTDDSTMFSMLDELIEDGTVFFDTEEDAWWLPGDWKAYNEEGGVWSDERDYEAGFKR